MGTFLEVQHVSSRSSCSTKSSAGLSGQMGQKEQQHRVVGCMFLRIVRGALESVELRSAGVESSWIKIAWPLPTTSPSRQMKTAQGRGLWHGGALWLQKADSSPWGRVGRGAGQCISMSPTTPLACVPDSASQAPLRCGGNAIVRCSLAAVIVQKLRGRGPQRHSWEIAVGAGL